MLNPLIKNKQIILVNQQLWCQIQYNKKKTIRNIICINIVIMLTKCIREWLVLYSQWYFKCGNIFHRSGNETFTSHHEKHVVKAQAEESISYGTFEVQEIITLPKEDDFETEPWTSEFIESIKHVEMTAKSTDCNVNKTKAKWVYMCWI